MARNPETKQYIKWDDVCQLQRWLEWGYNVEIRFVQTVVCPPGEHYLRLQLELLAFDRTGEPVPLPVRILGRFPTHNAATVPGVQFAMLWKAEAEIGGVRLWTEPTLGRKPQARAAA